MFGVTFIRSQASAWKREWQLFVEVMHQSVHRLGQLGFKVDFEQHDDQLSIRSHLSQGMAADEAHHVFTHIISSLVADYVVDHLEDFWLVDMIQDTYGYKRLEEISRLYLYCDQVLNGGSIEEQADEVSERWEIEGDKAKIEGRKQMVYERIRACINQTKTINLYGFFQFRLKEYRQQLKEAVEHAIDELILDQEYERFVQLLRLFVTSQLPKCPLLHVVHLSQRQFHVYDEEERLVTQDELMERLAEWTGSYTNQDELIISALMSYLPRRIVLHTPHPEQVVIYTLQRIFGERLRICTGCAQCEQWKKKGQTHTQL